MVVVIVLLAAPILAAALFWGSWGWTAAALAVAAVEFATLRRSERFSARVWRTIPIGHRHSRERTTETAYVAAAVAGLVLLVIAVARLV